MQLCWGKSQERDPGCVYFTSFYQPYFSSVEKHETEMSRLNQKTPAIL